MNRLLYFHLVHMHYYLIHVCYQKILATSTNEAFVLKRIW